MLHTLSESPEKWPMAFEKKVGLKRQPLPEDEPWTFFTKVNLRLTKPEIF